MEELEKLYKVLSENEYYTKTYEEFVSQYEDPEYRKKVYDLASSEGMYSSDFNSFESKYAAPVKKKDTSESISPEDSMVYTSEMDSSDFKEASKKAAEDPKYDVGDYEFDDRFSAGAKDVFASILRIPQFLQEQAATIVASGLSLFDPELKETLDSMSREERDIFLGNIPTVSSAVGASGTTMASEEYTKEAEKIRDSFEKFDTSITEDIIDLELGRAAGRLFNETVGAVPSIIQAFIPGVGIGSIALGSAAQKSKELQDKGEELGVATSLNSIITGAGEGLLETFTKKIGGKFFKSLKGKSEEFVMKSMSGFAKEFGIDFLGEGASESGSLLIGKLADYAISGDEKAFENSLYEFTDTFLVGGFATGPISGATQGVNITRQIAKKREIDRAVSSTKYTSLSDAFTNENVAELDNEQLSLVEKDSAESLLKLQLAERLKKKELNNDKAKEILDNFKNTKTLGNEVDGLDLTEDQKQQATNLIREKRNLEKTIQGKDDNLVSKQKNRIEEINNNLKSLSEGVDITQQEEVAPTEKVTVEEALVVQENEQEQALTKPKLTTIKEKVKSGKNTYMLEERGTDIKIFREDGTEVPKFIKRQLKRGMIGDTRKAKNPGYVRILSNTKGIVSDAKIEKERQQYWEQAKERFSSESPKAIVDAWLADGGKVSRQTIKDEIGGDPKGFLWATGIKEEKTLPTIAGVSENLARNFGFGEDNEPFRNALIESISSYTGVDSIKDDYIDKLRDEEQSMMEQQEIEAVDDFIEPNEKSLLDSAISEEEALQSMSEEEAISYYEEQYRKQFESLTEDEQAAIIKQQETTDEQTETEPESRVVKEESVDELPTEPETQQDVIQQAVVEKKRKSTKEQIKEKQAEENVFISTDQILGKGGFVDGLKRRWISYKKFLPESLFKAKEARDGAIKKYTTRAEAFARAYDNTVNKIVRSDKTIKNKKQAKQNIQTEFDKLLRGEITPNDSPLNDDLLILATKMRTQIDALSNELVRLGYIKSRKSVENIIKNKGSYLNRSYKVFTNENWKDAVSDEIKQQAKNYILNNASKLRGDQKYSLSEKARKMSFGEDISYEQALEDLVDLEIDKILNRDVASGFIKSAATGSLNKKILKQRKDIPLPIRQLMGEDIDPANNYMNSVLKLSALVENVKYQNQIRKNGLGVYFFEEGDVSRPKEFSRKITSDKSEAFPLLKGLYTTPELAEAFESQQKNNSEFMNNFMMVGGYVKWAKTVGSLATHFKNFVGNLGFAMINGHYDVKELKKSWETVIGDLKGLTDDEFRAKFEKYVELGIIKQSASIGDVKAAIDYKNSDDVFQQILANEKKNNELKKSNAVSRLINKTMPTSKVAEFAATKISETASKTKTLLDNLYQSEDDFWKIHGYENELSQYSKALFGKEKSQLTPDERAKVDKEVSEIIKNQYPTYDRVPEIIKRLGKNPFLGAFVSFQAESIRTAFNTYAQAQKELKSTNPEVRRIGGKRIAAAGTYTATKLAVFSALGTLLVGGEDDNEEKKDVRKILPPWSKNSSVVLLESEPGKLDYIDITANDPHAIFSKLVNSAIREEDIVSKFTEASLELLKPFVGKDLLFAAGTEIFNNEKSSGSPLYKDGDNTADKLKAVSFRIYELFEPGTFTTVRRGYDAYKSDDKKLSNELVGFTGVRPVSLDLNTSMFFNVKDLSKDIADQKSVYNSARYKKLSDSSIDLDSKYNQVNQVLREKYLEGHELVKSVMRLGLTDREIVKILKDQRFSKKEIRMMLSGRIYDYFPSKMRR